MNRLIGLKVVDIRGFLNDKRKTKYIEPQYILFSDGQTYIELEEQDYYSYHDCSQSARLINIQVNEERWLQIFNDKIYYPKANIDI